MNGRQFKRLREQLELSQQEVAEVLGFSGRQAVCNIETGIRKPGRLAGAVLSVLTSLPRARSTELQALLRAELSATERKKGRSK